MARRRLIENIVSMSALEALTYGLPLVTVPYLGITLGAATLGKFAFVIAVTQSLTVLTDYGLSWSAVREVAVHRDDPGRVARIAAAVLSLRLALAVAGLILMLGVIFSFERLRADASLYLAGYVQVIGQALFPNWLLQGLERFKLLAAVEIAARCASVVAIFAFVGDAGDAPLAVLLQCSPPMLAFLLLAPALRGVLRRVPLAFPSVEEIRYHVHGSWHLFVTTVAIAAYTSSNTLWLGYVASPVQVAYFHVCQTVVQAALAVFKPISRAVYPVVSKLAADDPAAALRFLRKLALSLGPFSLALSISMFVMAGPIVRAWFGGEFAPAATVLAIGAVQPFLIAMSNVFGIQTMLPFGMNATVSRIVLCAAIVNVSLFLPLAWWYGATGAVISVVIVEVFVTVAMGAVLHIHGKNPLTSAGSRRDHTARSTGA